MSAPYMLNRLDQDPMVNLNDYFTVEMQTSTGQVLPYIEFDGQKWFVAEPGQEFVVQVAMVNYTKQDYRVGTEGLISGMRCLPVDVLYFPNTVLTQHGCPARLP